MDYQLTGQPVIVGGPQLVVMFTVRNNLGHLVPRIMAEATTIQAKHTEMKKMVQSCPVLLTLTFAPNQAVYLELDNPEYPTCR